MTIVDYCIGFRPKRSKRLGDHNELKLLTNLAFSRYW